MPCQYVQERSARLKSWCWRYVQCQYVQELKHIYENIFDPELCLHDMVSSRMVMRYGEIKPGDWERRRNENEEERWHTAELFKRRVITLLILVSVLAWSLEKSSNFS